MEVIVTKLLGLVEGMVGEEGMAYVPYQQSGKQYSVETAIEKGTLFPVLNKPFCCTGEV